MSRVTVNQTITTLSGATPGVLPSVLAQATKPALINGLVSDWPLVQHAQKSVTAADAYLRQFYQGASVGVFCGSEANDGRFFYNEDLTGFNFERHMEKLDQVLDRILEQFDQPHPRSYYVGSTTVDACLPGFRTENDLDFGDLNPLASIWIGNRCRIAAHYDVPDNLACVAAGRRRFTLFPPDQLENLYVGPLDFTPAGQQISLVDFHQPDFQRFPRFKQALESAYVVDTAPGDAIFIPSMWWHHVESLDNLNVLVNYWWRNTPDYLGPPIHVLHHALLSLRDLPLEQKQAWRGILDHYIFNENTSLDHIPIQSRGSLGELDADGARKLRALLLNRLNR
jgi:hypothetical protein